MVILALDADGPLVAICDDEGGQLAAGDATGVESLGVVVELETHARVVAVDGGGAVSVGEAVLVFVP